MRLRRAKIQLADAQLHPHAGYDIATLERGVADAERPLDVAHRRAAADRELKAQKKETEARLAAERARADQEWEHRWSGRMAVTHNRQWKQMLMPAYTPSIGDSPKAAYIPCWTGERIVTGNISAQGAISGGALFDLIKKMNRIELYQGTPVSNVRSLSALVQDKERTP